MEQQPDLFTQDGTSNVVDLDSRRSTNVDITPDEYRALMRAAAARYHGEQPQPVRVAALARETDPDTSRQAAASISQDSMRETQRMVLAILERYGPSCDEDIATYAAQLTEHEGWPRQSPSGLRSRRAELVAAGLVRDSGERTRTSTGRQTIVWEHAGEGQ